MADSWLMISGFTAWGSESRDAPKDAYVTDPPRPWSTVKSCKVELAEARMALAAGGPRSQPEGGGRVGQETRRMALVSTSS